MMEHRCRWWYLQTFSSSSFSWSFLKIKKSEGENRDEPKKIQNHLKKKFPVNSQMNPHTQKHDTIWLIWMFFFSLKITFVSECMDARWLINHKTKLLFFLTFNDDGQNSQFKSPPREHYFFLITVFNVKIILSKSWANSKLIEYFVPSRLSHSHHHLNYSHVRDHSRDRQIHLTYDEPGVQCIFDYLMCHSLLPHFVTLVSESSSRY